MVARIFKKYFLFLIAPLIFVPLMGVNECCLDFQARAFISDPPEFEVATKYHDPESTEPLGYLNNPVYNVHVAGFGNMTEYRYKYGQEADIDCASESGYSSWLPASQDENVLDLELNFVGAPDGVYDICLLGRGTTTCSHKGSEQLPENATHYKFRRDTTGPSTTILGPSGNVTSPTIEMTWSQAIDAVTYTASVNTNTNCGDLTKVQEFAGLIGTSQAFTLPSAGTYYLCLSATDEQGNTAVASNQGQLAVAFQDELVTLDNTTAPNANLIGTWLSVSTSSGEDFKKVGVRYSPSRGEYLKEVSALILGGLPTINMPPSESDWTALTGFWRLRIWAIPTSTPPVSGVPAIVNYYTSTQPAAPIAVGNYNLNINPVGGIPVRAGLTGSGRQKWLATFNLSGMNVILDPNYTYMMEVSVINTSNAPFIYILESNLPGLQGVSVSKTLTQPAPGAWQYMTGLPTYKIVTSATQP